MPFAVLKHFTGSTSARFSIELARRVVFAHLRPRGRFVTNARRSCLSLILLTLVAVLPVRAQQTKIDNAIKAAIRRKLAGDSLVTGIREVRDSATLERKYLHCDGSGDNKRCSIRDGKPLFTIDQIEVFGGDSASAIVALWNPVQDEPRIRIFSQVWSLRLRKGRWIATKTDEVSSTN